jgi:hypothetical protein
VNRDRLGAGREKIGAWVASSFRYRPESSAFRSSARAAAVRPSPRKVPPTPDGPASESSAKRREVSTFRIAIRAWRTQRDGSRRVPSRPARWYSGRSLPLSSGARHRRAFAGILVFIASSILAVVLAAGRRSQAKAACGPGCVIPEPAVSYLGWSGTVSEFSFFSPSYAAKFATGNMRNLINVGPGLRQLLEQHTSEQRVAVAEPPSTARQPAIRAPQIRGSDVAEVARSARAVRLAIASL